MRPIALRIAPELLAVTLLLAINLVSVSYRYAWAVAQPWQGAFWAVPTLILLACAVLMLTAIPTSETGADGRADLLVLSTIVFSFVLTLYQTATNQGVLLGVSALGLSIIILFRFEAMRRITDFIVAAAIAWTAYYALQGNYRQIGGDLLPIIVAACQNLLSGLDPYTADYRHVTSNPFFYLPLQWLPYLPAVALAKDPRAVTVTIFLVFAGVVRLSVGTGLRLRPAMLLLTLLTTALCARAMARTYMLPSWILLACFIFAFAKGRDIAAALLLGCLLATRQTFVIDAAAILVGLIFQMPMRQIFVLAAISLLTVTMITLPFMISDNAFLWQAFVHGPALALAGNSRNFIAVGQVGIVPLLVRLGLEAPPAVIQGTVVILALAAIALRRPKDRLSLALGVAGVDLLTSLSGGQTFEYYWGSSFVITGAALCCAILPAGSARAPIAPPHGDKADGGLVEMG